MADSTINGLTALSGANVDNTADQFAIWDNSDNTTKKITRTEVLTGIPAGTAAAPAISFAGDADTGIYSGAANSFSISTGGSERVYVHTNGQVRLGYAGAVATPTLASTADVNTGIYFPAADTLGLVTGGVERVRVDSAGRVGIGTVSTSSYPSSALAVAGLSTTLGLVNIASTDTGGGADLGGSIQLGGDDGVVSTRGYAVISGRKENATSGDYASYLSFGTRANLGSITERMRINSAGQVGIGKTPTLGLLDVNGDSYFNTVRVGLGNGGVSTNTAVGVNTIAGASVTGARNTGVGSGSLNALSSGNDNVAVGRSTLSAVASASNNTAIGASALAANTASDNTACGYAALTLNSSGTANVAVGRSAGASNTTGSSNTIVGRSAYNTASTGSFNTAIGHNSLSAATTSNDNTAVGYTSGNTLTTGASNTIIGSGANASAAAGTGQIVLGKGVTGTANNRITVGITTNIAELDLDGADTSWAASSDERLKKNVADYAAGLDVITALRPVTYQWRSRKEVPTELTNYYADSDEPVHGDASKTYHGFIAQEVKAVLDANPSVPNGQHLWEQRDDGVQTLAPADLVPILVNAIKQLHAEVQALKNA